MKTVIATDRSACLGVNIKELGRIAKEGEEFECTDDRFRILSGNNKYKAVFVIEKKVVKEPVVESATDAEKTAEEPVVEETKTTKKKTTKKKVTEETTTE